MTFKVSKQKHLSWVFVYLQKYCFLLTFKYVDSLKMQTKQILKTYFSYTTSTKVLILTCTILRDRYQLENSYIIFSIKIHLCQANNRASYRPVRKLTPLINCHIRIILNIWERVRPDWCGQNRQTTRELVNNWLFGLISPQTSTKKWTNMSVALTVAAVTGRVTSQTCPPRINRSGLDCPPGVTIACLLCLCMCVVFVCMSIKVC